MFNIVRDKIFGINKLKYFILNRQINSDSNQKYFFKELKALEILKEYIPSNFLFETDYSLSFQTIQHIINDIYYYKPKVILEFGSGLSTIIINNFLAKENIISTKFISIDEDKEWQVRLSSKCPFVDFFCFEVSKESNYSTFENEMWYNIPDNHHLNSMKFDLVIIDAPKGSNKKMARYGVLPFLKGRIDNEVIVFLDDTNRKSEEFLSKELSLELNLSQIFKSYNYSRISRPQLFSTSPK